MSEKWEIDFIDDNRERLNGASFGTCAGLLPFRSTIIKRSTYSLRYFIDLLSSSITSSISAGLRSDAFLFADASAISYLNHPASDASLNRVIPGLCESPFSTKRLIPGYVNVVDASYNSAKIYAHSMQVSLVLMNHHESILSQKDVSRTMSSSCNQRAAGLFVT